MAPRRNKKVGPAPANMHAGFQSMMAALEERTGYKLEKEDKVILPGETFRQWCDRLSSDRTLANGRPVKGLKVDGRAFKLDDRPAMAWVYDQIPSTEEAAYRFVLVLQKCAQVGFTVMEMLATIYLGLRFGPATVGMFLPDMNLASVKSTERFMPIVRSVPEVKDLMTQDAVDGSGRKKGEGNVNRRRIGDALFVFSWTSGRASTESIPMDILSFDEVQEMTLDQMEKTVERLSASPVRFTLMGSTANYPDADINHWYKRGSKHRFYTRCPVCGAAKPLDEYFPDCIAWDAEKNIYRYVCPNGHWLEDTQNGEWVPENPAADAPIDPSIPQKDRPIRIRSVHFTQFLSPTVSAGEIMQKYRDSTDKKNFYNRVLGKPYLDPSQVPVSLEHMNRCVEAGRAAGVVWKKSARGTFMGIDQMGNYNVVIIKERLPDGRQAVVHVEMIYSADPFARCDALMNEYGVSVCVVEINPNYNDAKRFANRHSGRVFICDSFGSLPDDMLKWGDASKLDTSERRTSDEERDRYTVRIDQFKCMQTSMARFTGKEPICLWPDPQTLVQEVIEKGILNTVAVAPIAFTHFTKTALVTEKNKETNQFKRVVKKIGIDPHFSYANLLCDVAWARAYGTATFILPSAETPKSKEEVSAAQNMPGLPNEVVGVLESVKDLECCGTCDSFDSAHGLCRLRDLLVAPRDVSCVVYVRDQYAEQTK